MQLPCFGRGRPFRAPPAGYGDYAFILHILASLSDAGRAGKALNFDENIREEALIDWEALKATVPDEVARCMESFKGITIADTRECATTSCSCRGGAIPRAGECAQSSR